MILGTAGHIDHGKTSLVHALTGVDTDRLPEEKRRGITIELGFAPLVLDGVGTIGVVDVPGHEAFVRTMVAGATGIDLALIVVAADEGVMPQTREHLAILELLGVRNAVIALTKVDLVDDDWLALVVDDVRSATSRAFPDANIIATSTRTSRGIEELRGALADLARTVTPRAEDDLFRLPVDRTFTIRGTGTVVTGTVWSGRVTRDETVRILPGDRTARVRGIQGHGAQLDVATPSGRTAIALSGVDVADVPRGSTIVTDRDWRATTLARADITLVPGIDLSIRPRTWYRFHVGTTEVGARIVARGMSATEPFAARVVLDEPVILRAGDRFVIRTSAPLNTIAGGVITDPYPPRRARPWLPGASVEQRIDQLLAENAIEGVESSTLPVRLGVSPAGCRHLLAGAADRLEQARGRIVSRATLAAIESAMIAAVVEYQRDHSLEPGMPTQLLRAGFRAPPEIVEFVMDGQLSGGALVSGSGTVSTTGWTPTPSPEQAALLKTLVHRLETAGAEPPAVEELTAEFGVDTGALLRFLERRSEVTQVEQNRYYADTQLRGLIDRLREAMASGAELSPSEIREALGLSRKFLIPFLEYCDRLGYTNRGTTGRIWRAS
ncbi:MAG TPA: selenocysteine-specific translation elongation factor [Gemmatimonadaceae bacterium]|nr:selenocysteine-specific translation elongation factor [Gemmatimonadaceae bacterium]